MNFDAILFDLDGTLLDSIEDLADSMNAVLDKSGYPRHDIEDYKIFVGDGIFQLAERVLPGEVRNTEAIQRCVRKMKIEYGLRWDKKSRPYPGVPELLDELTRWEIPINIFSNKPDEFTRLTVAKLLPAWTFAHIIGLRHGIPAKPDPEGALKIAKSLEIPPERFLYLGDTNTDMMTAKNAGMYPVGALWGFRKREELLQYGARRVIEHPTDLLRFF